MKRFKVKCLHACTGHIYVIHNHIISPMKRFNFLETRSSQWKKVDNFQRNAHDEHLLFKNEANFSRREAFLLMKISYKFGKASWSSFLLRALTSKISLRMALEP